MRLLHRAFVPRALLAVGLTVASAGLLLAPAGAVSGPGEVEFDIHGTLPTFPVAVSTDTTIWGTLTGVSEFTGAIGSNEYTAEVDLRSAAISGWVQYNEPAGLTCPLIGNAEPSQAPHGNGQLSFSAGSPTVSGSVYRAGDKVTGVVTNVSTTFAFSYLRVGAVAVLTFASSNIAITFNTVGVGTQTLNTPWQGEGAAAFVVNPVDAFNRCSAPGELPFELAGLANLAG